jgi:hypothetical protein
MLFLIILLLISGLILFIMYKIALHTILWVAEPLVKHLDEKEHAEQQFRTEMSKIPGQLKILIDGYEKSFRVSKQQYDLAQVSPQQLRDTNVWIYKNHIFAHMPTIEEIRRIDRGIDNN